ncbi:hypothetical protein SAMN04488052_103378 [Aquisalimonas asiatica]|uniref:Uncharacterized protein n=1 Tax=Aquisalimonas asiatica TaxID=406100 RepID=A0A1H8T340_9GAMM|nr:hypothetical protein SAMN04488052_103378 [Aquisalimonas asiatica]
MFRAQYNSIRCALLPKVMRVGWSDLILLSTTSKLFASYAH